MRWIRRLALAVLALAVMAPGATAAITIDRATRTVTTPRLTVGFDATNPEQINTLYWAGTGMGVDLAADGGLSPCGDTQETWGQSYSDPFPMGKEVSSGSRGPWQSPSDGVVAIESQVTVPDCSGFDGQNPVQTTYRFTEGDQIAVTRRFAFDPDDPTRFTQNHLRPYVPRMPRSPYTHTLWPSDTGFNDSIITSCTLNFCARPNWAGTWFAQHDPDTGKGLLVLRAPSPVPARLLVDNDTPSVSNSSSVDLIPAFYDGPITETEYLCFYTDATWPPAEREASKAPSWCGPSLSIAGATVSEAQGTATLFVTRSLIADPGPTFGAVAEDGTAVAGEDYGKPVAGTFSPGSPTAQVTVPIVDDQVHEDDRTFTVRLTDAKGARIDGASATVTIRDDDPAPVVPPPPVRVPRPVFPLASGGPVSKLRASQLVALPSARSCRTRRPAAFRIRLREPKGTKIARTVVRLNGRVVKTARGTTPITIANLPKGKVTVTVAVRTATGVVVTATHAYKACAR